MKVRLDCSPCYSYNAGQSKPCPDNICLAEFEPDDVYLYIRNLVGTMGSKKDDFLPVVYNVLPKQKGRMTRTSGS